MAFVSFRTAVCFFMVTMLKTVVIQFMKK